ncbi:MAG: NACHT domain-containing protein [Planctomycetota bacterium]
MHEEHKEFENEVLRVARALWPAARYSGSVRIDGRERDGVFETEECIHLIEATTSRRLEKAKEDISKLVGLASKLQKTTSSKAMRCWFVTREEPTADQRHAGEKHRAFLTVLGFSQFQARLVDARAYLAARENHAFGSVRDPVTGSLKPHVDYVPLALAEQSGAAVLSPDEVVNGLIADKRFLLLGDYGAGKSMTLQYVHRKLSSGYYKGESSHFPVYVNLRDHYGQTEPAEILERHARIIGFDSPAHLVRAWRAGYVYLLLDGFDEVTTLSIQGLWRKLRDSRYRAMEPVRRLISGHPRGPGIIVAGRAHFFDSERERRSALGLDDAFVELSLNEFSDEQLETYLRGLGLPGAVPSWLPSRPLLVAYLASKGLLQGVIGEWAGDLDPGVGWDMLIDKIAHREAQIEAGIDGPTVRRILERLATKARVSPDGLGPLSTDEIVAAFGEVCGYPPDDRGMLLLQRLPGLGVDQGESETRRFVDESFVEACRAGDVLSFAENPYDASGFPPNMECGAGSLGISITARRVQAQSLTSGHLTAAIERACNNGHNYLASDLVGAAVEAGLEIGSHVYIKDVLIREIEFSSGMRSAAGVHYQECLFGELALDPDIDGTKLPRFTRCFVAVLEGRISPNDLPPGAFDDCDFESFSTAAGTTNQILDLPIALGVRVLITVLKKLFERRGSGRRESALYRGLDHRARRAVPDILQLLRSHGIAYPCRRGTETVWIPDRSARPRAGRILASPSAKDDPLVIAAAELPVVTKHATT